MAITTKDPHAWFICESSSGERQTVYNDETYEHNYPFGYEVNFNDSATPPVDTVTLFNMAKSHRNFYKKKEKCYLAFNWGSSKKILSEGYITKIDTNESDGTTDTLVITYTQGTDYQNVEARKLKLEDKKKVNHYKTKKKKVPGKWVTKRVHYYTTENGKKVGHYKEKKKYQKSTTKNVRVKTRVTKTFLTNMTFKKGKSYKFIIKAVAKQAGIVISKTELAKNPTIKKSYTAKGKPLTVLKKLVEKCDSKMTYVKGKLEIVNPKSKKRTWIVVDDDDLLQPPTFNEDDSDDDGTWEIITPLIPEVTTNVGIIMKSRYLTGKYYVSSGQHTSDGTNPQTQMSLKSA